MSKSCANCDHYCACSKWYGFDDETGEAVRRNGGCWSGWHDAKTDPPKEEFKKDYLVLEETDEGVQHYGISMFYGFGQMCQGVYEYPDGVWEGDAYGFKVIAWRELPEYEVEK